MPRIFTYLRLVFWFLYLDLSNICQNTCTRQGRCEAHHSCPLLIMAHAGRKVIVIHMDRKMSEKKAIWCYFQPIQFVFLSSPPGFFNLSLSVQVNRASSQSKMDTPVHLEYQLSCANFQTCNEVGAFPCTRGCALVAVSDSNPDSSRVLLTACKVLQCHVRRRPLARALEGLRSPVGQRRMASSV